MDPELLRQVRQREVQQLRAHELGPKFQIEAKKPRKPRTGSLGKAKLNETGESGSFGPAPKPTRGQSSGHTPSTHKFQILSKIVRHLKSKFQNGEDFPLALDELLDETNQMGTDKKVMKWLQEEALPNNPKIQNKDGKFMFNPPLQCRNQKSLLRLLKVNDMRGLGGIMRDDVLESVPHADKVLKKLDPQIITIIRHDKKKVLFYKDIVPKFEVDEEFKVLWRTVTVDGITDSQIEEYLGNAGIKSMESQVRKMAPKIKAVRRKAAKKLKDNEHMAEILNNYDV